MKVRRISAVLLAALTIVPLHHAQTALAPDIGLPPGDAARGQAVFEGKGNCMSCHRVDGSGSLFGPDLSSISAPRGGGGGARGGAAAPPAGATGAGGRGGQGGNAPALPTPQQFAQSILDPNAVVSVQNRYVRLRMKDGKIITGKLLSVDTFNVQIFDSTERLANISRENVSEMTMTSPMPSYRDKLTTQELSDLVSYLMSLKGQQ